MGAARRRWHGCAARRMAPPLPDRVTVVRGLPRPPRRLVLGFSSPVRLAVMREAQRRVVSNWEARWARGGFGIVSRIGPRGRDQPQAAARRPGAPSRSTCPSPASPPRRASEATTTTTAWSRRSASSPTPGRGASRLTGTRPYRASVSNLAQLHELLRACEPASDLLVRAAPGANVTCSRHESISQVER